ncbi:hypothetical protein AGMMS49938_07560 [Fibrobacterales bacterium]|nr:hypothetical protein AGMMS49938_07560 [Fibrobacterales bacterium]
MNKIYYIVLILCSIAFAQGQKMSIAVLPVDASMLSADEQKRLTDEFQAKAVEVLGQNFNVMSQNTIIQRLGNVDNYVKVCKEASCIADIGKKVSANYVAQVQVIQFGEDYSVGMELYNVADGNILDKVPPSDVKNVYQIVNIIKSDRTADLFRKIPGAGGLLGDAGIFGVTTESGGFEIGKPSKHIVNVSSNPSGAILTVDGTPLSSCSQTPCSFNISRGKHVFAVALNEYYEPAKKTVDVNANNQRINLELSPLFGTLKITPTANSSVWLGGNIDVLIGENSGIIGENNLLPSKYKVTIKSDCYGTSTSTAIVVKNKTIEFAPVLQPKMSGLDLTVEDEGKPQIVNVYANNEKIGETPFVGKVPVCSQITIGDSKYGKENIPIKLIEKQTTEYTHEISNAYKAEKARIVAEKVEKERQAEIIAEMEWQRENARRIEAEERERKLNGWQGAVTVGGGVQLGMNYIDDNFTSVGGLFVPNVEFYKGSFDIFHFGINLSIAGAPDRKVIRKKYNADSISWTPSINGNVFLRLYPVNVFFLSGGIGMFHNGLDFSRNGKKSSASSSYGMEFPIGVGIAAGNFLVLEGLYHIVSNKNTGNIDSNKNKGYFSVSLGFRYDTRTEFTKQQVQRVPPLEMDSKVKKTPVKKRR